MRATDANGTCVATSQTQVAISFAEEDLNGGIYYWQSVASPALHRAPTGGIFRYDFGKRGQTPRPFLAPDRRRHTMNRCIGCHFLSRDGAKMTYGNDDPDADDEYSDLTSTLIDVATKAAVQLEHAQGGFQAFSPDHSHVPCVEPERRRAPRRPSSRCSTATRGAAGHAGDGVVGQRARDAARLLGRRQPGRIRAAGQLRLPDRTAASTTTTSPAAACSR